MRKLLLLLPIIVMISCKQKSKKTVTPSEDTVVVKKDTTQTVTDSREAVDSNQLYTLAGHILGLIKNRKYDSLVQYFHPDGVRFSPYTYVDTTDQVITKEKLLDMVKKKTKINWNSDWSGEDPEKLTVDQYFKGFVYDVDFLTAPRRTLNRFGIRGSDINNIDEFYPNANTVEYFFAGFDKKYEGMDFRGLNLVFRLYQSRPMLVGVTHNQWTP
jgi:hypothetical protein